MSKPEEQEPQEQETEDISRGPSVEEMEVLGSGGEPREEPSQEEETEEDSQGEEKASLGEEEVVRERSVPKGDQIGLKELLAQLPKQLAEAVRPPAQPQPQPEGRQWKPLQFSAADVEKLYAGGDEAAEFLNNLVMGVISNVAELVVPYVERQYEPLRQYVTQREYDSLKGQFFQKYDDLASHEEFVVDVANRIAANAAQQGKAYQSYEEFFNEVATAARGLIKKFEEQYEKKRGGKNSATPPRADAPKARSPSQAKGKLTPEQEEMAAVAGIRL
jgi:hypothetical protein